MMDKFITASEALKISSESFVVPDDLKKKISERIWDAANQGKRIVLLTGIPVLFNGTFTNENLVESKEQKAVLRFLRENGYTARFVEDGGAYVPRGRQDDNGNGPLFTNCYIEVNW